jgi:hypothetical protein
MKSSLAKTKVTTVNLLGNLAKQPRSHPRTGFWSAALCRDETRLDHAYGLPRGASRTGFVETEQMVLQSTLATSISAKAWVERISFTCEGGQNNSKFYLGTNAKNTT